MSFATRLLYPFSCDERSTRKLLRWRQGFLHAVREGQLDDNQNLSGITLFTAEDDDGEVAQQSPVEEGGSAAEVDEPTAASASQAVDDDSIVIHIDGQTVNIDAQTAHVLAEASGLFRHYHTIRTREIPLHDFPGGITVLRETLQIINSGDEAQPLRINDGNVLHLYEAAWLLECPQVLDKVNHSPYMRCLTLARRSELVRCVEKFMDGEAAKAKVAMAHDSNGYGLSPLGFEDGLQSKRGSKQRASGSKQRASSELTEGVAPILDLLQVGYDEEEDDEEEEEEPYEWDESLRWRTPRSNSKGHVGTLKVVLAGAWDLKKGGANSSVSPYAFVSVGGQRLRTPTVKDNCNPEWNCTLCFVVRNEHMGGDVDFSLWDDDPGARSSGHPDRSVGQLDFPLTRAIEASPLVLREETLNGTSQGNISVRLEYLPVDRTKHKCEIDIQDSES